MSSYQVLFSGDVIEGALPAAVQDNLARELGIDARKAKALFAGRTVVLKSQLSEEDAQAFQQRLADLGAVARIKSLAPEPKPLFEPSPRRENAGDYTLRDITAAHIECPRCGHLQLESSHCARCGVDLKMALKQKRKEDLIIERRIRALREQSPQAASQATAASAPPAANDDLDAA
ncbi:MAG: hypothetical protein AAF648_15375, partial [Pseudomonadota bacterium]